MADLVGGGAVAAGGGEAFGSLCCGRWAGAGSGFNVGDYITRSAGSLVSRGTGLRAASGRAAGRRPPASRALVMRPDSLLSPDLG